MAWIDDRVWCHPKIVGLTANAYRAHINGIAYSSGFATNGILTPEQQKMLGATAAVRKELIAAELWDVIDDGSIQIHDWEEHNGKRDARRRLDRERKRLEREKDPDSWVIRSGRWHHTRDAVFERDGGVCIDCGEVTDGWHADHVPDRKTLREQGLDPFDLQFIQTRCQTCHGRRHILERTGQGQKQGQNADRRALTSDGVTGSEVKRTALKAVPADDEKTLEVRKLLRHLKDTDEGTEGVLLSYARRLPLSSVAKVRESCETRRVGAGYAVNALQSELAEIAEQNGG